MTTLKPIAGTSKKPLYYDEVVQIYEIVKLKPKTNHNPTDALEELKKQLANKKSIKAKLMAREDAIEFKKKGVGKSLSLKLVPYEAVKTFYQF